MAEIKSTGAVVIEFSRAEFELVKLALSTAYNSNLLIPDDDTRVSELLADLDEVA